jgi:hypothetical protein
MNANNFPVENVEGINNPDFMKAGEYYVFTLEGYGYEPITMTGLYMGGQPGEYKFFVYAPKQAEGIYTAKTIDDGHFDPVEFTSIRQATPQEIAALPIEAVEARVQAREREHNMDKARRAAVKRGRERMAEKRKALHEEEAAVREQYNHIRNVKRGGRRKTKHRKTKSKTKHRKTQHRKTK